MVGGAPARRQECAVRWHEFWCELVPSRLSGLIPLPKDELDSVRHVEINTTEADALVDLAASFDIVCCESPEALLLHWACARRGLNRPAIISLEVHGLLQVRVVRESLSRETGGDPWDEFVGSRRVAWIAASDVQARALAAAGVPAEVVHRLDASGCVYSMMLPDAEERLNVAPCGDDHLAPEVPRDCVLVPGTGRRDPATWLAAAALLPDLPFVSLGEPRHVLERHWKELGFATPLPFRQVPAVPLEDFIAAVRRSRICVVCLRPGDGDGGHTSVSVAHALGVPVVASDVPGVRDYVCNGSDARVVPPSDPRALATAIRWLWEDDDVRSKLRSEGLEVDRRRRRESTHGVLSMLRLVTS